ncbi:hypothetical protein [Methanosarcina sp. 2.H.A.1B.4]|nr:hypothetical protein [Methanosarcina sp. 2.H.A.1B.4]
MNGEKENNRIKNKRSLNRQALKEKMERVIAHEPTLGTDRKKGLNLSL